MNREITLAIETAVGGGSISLLENNEEIAYWIGEGELSKAEDLLFRISELFTNNNLEKQQLINIIYSLGPGSFTGIRIALATAKGLKTALGCTIRGQNVLPALILKTKKRGKVQTAIQCSKNQICRQFFEIGIDNYIKVLTEPEMIFDDIFLSSLKDTLVDVFVAGEEYFATEMALACQGQDFVTDKVELISPTHNIAGLIGRFAHLYPFKSCENSYPYKIKR